MRTLTIALLLTVFASRPAFGAEPVATPDKSPAKTYRNPLLPDREIADPFVLRVEGKYYL
jgi:hypothetical protein